VSFFNLRAACGLLGLCFAFLLQIEVAIILHTPGAQSGTARVHGRPVVQNTDYIGNGAGLMDFVWRLQGRLGDYRREWRRLRAGGGAAGIQNP
jgi:hypothetical protein